MDQKLYVQRAAAFGADLLIEYHQVEAGLQDSATEPRGER